MRKISNNIGLDDCSKKLRIAVYCRVSSREQALYGYGIDAQKSKMDAYLSLFDVEVEEVNYYIDEGISAKNLNRPEVKRLIKDVKEDKVDAIYIYKLDWLSRSVIDIYNMIEMLIDHKCNLVAVMDNIDINSANGRLFVGILAIIAQWERETIIERTNDGLEEMVRQGKWPYASKPFGYNKNEDLILSVNEKEKKILYDIVVQMKSGMTIKEIERYLLKEYDITMSSLQIRKMLKREWYYGLFHYKGKTYTNICPKIYNEEDAEEIQKMISKRHRADNYDSRYYFRNKIKCVCGEILDLSSTKKGNKQYFYYVCPKCKMRINQDYIIEQSLYAISSEVSLKEIKNNTNKALRKYHSINRKIQDIHNKYINNKMDLNVYLTSLYRLEFDKKEQMAKIKTDKLIDFIRWEQMTDLERGSFVNNHIARIIVDVHAKIVVKVEYIHK